MTAEELANLGYQPGQMPTLFVPDQPGISDQDLQQFQASNPSNATPAADPNAQSQSIDPATLNAVSAPGTNFSSDPNGFVSDRPTTVVGPDGTPMVLPPNSGAANSYAGQPAPDQPADQSAQPTQQPAQLTQQPAQPTQQNQLPGVDFYTWAKQNYGLERGQQITLQEKLKLLELHNDYQKELLKQQDPEKQLKIQQLQHSVANQGIDDQLKQAQAAESQSKVIAGELAKQTVMDATKGQISDLQAQRDQLLAVANHQELPSMTGLLGQGNPGITDKQRELKAMMAQLDGQQLINGINKIRDEASTPGSGLGFRITQQEAMAVKNAVNRLQRYQSPESYRNAANEYVGILNRAIAAKQAQLDRMPSVNQDLLKQFSYTPASSTAVTGSPAASSPSIGSAAAGAPKLRTVGGRTYQLNPATGGWRPIN